MIHRYILYHWSLSEICGYPKDARPNLPGASSEAISLAMDMGERKDIGRALRTHLGPWNPFFSLIFYASTVSAYKSTEHVFITFKQ